MVKRKAAMNCSDKGAEGVMRGTPNGRKSINS